MVVRSCSSCLLCALLLVPLGCSASGSRDNDFTPIVSDKAHPLADDDARNATIFSDRLEFPLASQGWLAGVTADDVLVSGYDFGFLRRVTSLETTASAIVVHTEPADLTDIVQQGQTETQIDYALLEPAGVHEFPGLSPQSKAGDPYVFTKDLAGEVVELADGVNARITKGNFSFKPSLDVGISVKDWSVVEAHALANGAFHSDLEVEIIGEVPINRAKEVEIWRSPALRVPLPPILGVPIVCTAWVAVKAGFTFDAKGQMKVTLGQTFDFDGQMGVRYSNDGGWENVRTFEPNWTPQQPTIGAEAQVDAKGYLGGALNIGFYAGPKLLGTGGTIEVEAKPYLRLQYDSTQPAPGWGLYSGLDLDATPSLKILHQSLAKDTFSLYHNETLQLPAQGANDPAPVDVGNCSDGKSDGVETGIDCGGQCATDCALGSGCVTDNDCTTSACVNGECAAASCGNGVQDGDETGVDCGGSCDACSGGTCQNGSDCASGNCVDGACDTSLDCYDEVQNGSETGVDCGGGCAPCYGDVPANCFDGQLSGDETDVDCGGSCSPCQGGSGGSCDGTGNCSTCTSCAQMGACADVTNACSANPDCGNLLTCVYGCADQPCVDNCFAMYPAGDPDFTNYDSCVTCKECFKDCGGVNFCP